MVEPVQVPDHDLPPNEGAYQLEGLVAVSAHPQVLHHPDGGPLGEADQSEPQGQPLAVQAHRRRLLPVGHRRPGIAQGPHPPLQLLQDLHHLPSPATWRHLPGVENLHGVFHLHPAAPAVLADAPPRHLLPHAGSELPPPRRPVPVRHSDQAPDDIPAGAHEAPQHVAGHGGDVQPPVGGPGGRQRGPQQRRVAALCRYAPGHGDGLVEPPRAAQHVYRAGVVRHAGRHAVGFLHAGEVLQPSVHQPRVAAGVEDPQEGDPIGVHPLLKHFVEQGQRGGCHPVLAGGGDHGREGYHVGRPQELEHSVGVLEAAALGVHVHQRAADDVVLAVAAAEHDGVGALPGAEPAQAGAGGDHAGEHEVVGGEGESPEELPEELEGLLCAGALRVGGEHGAPGDDVPVVHSVENFAGVAGAVGLPVHAHQRSWYHEVGVDAGELRHGVELATGAEGGHGGAGGEGGGEGEGVGGDAAGPHEAEEGEGSVGAAGGGEAAHEGGPGDDVGGAAHVAEGQLCMGGGAAAEVGVDEVIGGDGGERETGLEDLGMSGDHRGKAAGLPEAAGQQG